MNQAESLLISCGGTDQVDSFAVRGDNLATLVTYDGCRSIPSKHCTAISTPYILTVYVDRTKRLLSTHITSFVPRGESSLISDIECICTGGNSYFAAGSTDGTVRIWRISDGELVVEQQLHLGQLSCLYIDTTLWVIFAASTTGRVGAWAIPELFGSGEPESVWALHSLKVTDFAISTNSTRIYSVSLDKSLRCYDLALGCEILTVNFPSALTSVKLAHNEGIVYCGGIDGSIYQVHINQDSGINMTFEGHREEITDLVLSADDRSLYSSSLDLSVRRWDTSTGQSIVHIQTKSAPFALNFLPHVDQLSGQELHGTPGSQQISTSSSSSANNTNNGNNNNNNGSNNSRRQNKKHGGANNGKQKKGFPRLQRQIAGNVDEMISGVAEEQPILTADEEMSIAIADLCASNKASLTKVVAQKARSEVDANSADKKERSRSEKEENEQSQQESSSELDELKRQNGLMFQHILSQKFKSAE